MYMHTYVYAATLKVCSSCHPSRSANATLTLTICPLILHKLTSEITPLMMMPALVMTLDTIVC